MAIVVLPRVSSERSGSRTDRMEKDDIERFVASLGDYQPALPDELVRYYLSRSGFSSDDVRVDRLIALAAQKFLADIANDAIAHSKLRTTMTGRGKTVKDTRMVLTTDDLEKALKEYGVTLRKPPYYTSNSPAAASEQQQPKANGTGPSSAR